MASAIGRTAVMVAVLAMAGIPATAGDLTLTLKETELFPFALPLHPNGTVISPDSAHVACTCYEDNKWYIVRDGKKGKIYEGVGLGKWSPDSQHFAYIAYKDGKAFIVYDDKEQGPYNCTGKGSLQFSPDSKHIGYVGSKNDGWYVCRDGEEAGPYHNLYRVFFSPDGRRTAYQVRQNGRFYAVIDGKQTGGYDGLALDGFSFSPDSKHLAYWMVKRKDGKEFRVPVIDGTEGKLYGCVDNAPAIWSPDSTKVAFKVAKGGQWHILVNGELGKGYQTISNVQFSADSSKLFYIARHKDLSTVLVTNGKEGTPFDTYANNSLVVSPDGLHTMWVTSGGSKPGKMRIVIDDKPSKAYDGIMAQSNHFTGDGRLMYAARDDGRVTIFIDGEAIATYDDIRSLTPSPDGKHWAAKVKQHEKWHLAVDGKLAGSFRHFPPGSRIVFDSPTKLHTIAANLNHALRVEVELVDMTQWPDVQAKAENADQQTPDTKAAESAKPAVDEQAVKKASQLLQLGKQFENNRILGAARKRYREIIEKYPDTLQAKEARQRLEKLSEPSP